MRNSNRKRTLGEILEEVIRRWKSGENANVFFSSDVLADVAFLLGRAGFGIAGEILEQIPDAEHRRILSTLLCSTAAFAIAGATAGMHVAGPSGATVGAVIGACTGLAAGMLVVRLTLEPPPEGGGGYVFKLAPT